MTIDAKPDVPTALLLQGLAKSLSDLPSDDTISSRRRALLRMAELYGFAASPVGKIEERWFEGPSGERPLRIYYPQNADATPPLLLHIHGGGWSLGDFETYENVCRAYCQATKAIVVDVDYRRAPEHRFPSAHEDCEAALEWLISNATKLGGDPSRIAVTGDSAGGNLAASLCLRSPKAVWRQILVYPVLSASASAKFSSRERLGDGRFFLSEAAIRRAEAEYLRTPVDGDNPRASPLYASERDIARLPPTLIITAGLDPLRDEAHAYARRLAAARVPVEELLFESTIHAFVLFGGAIPAGRAAVDHIGMSLRTR